MKPPKDIIIFSLSSCFQAVKGKVIRAYLDTIEMTLGIVVTKVVQEPGDVVYLSPGAIHYGFNCGFNIHRYGNLLNI